MDQLALFYKCQSCSDYVLTSNIQCPNGHQVCQACFENLSHCPSCHQRVAPSTRVPFLLTTNVDPILNIGDSFDLLLPSLLRLAPALHPCTPDEMIFTDKPPEMSMNLIDNNTSMQKNNNIADQLLVANSGESIDDTLSRLMMLASMSTPTTQGPSSDNNSNNLLSNNLTPDNNATSTSSSTSSNNNIEPVLPPGLISSSTPLLLATPATTTTTTSPPLQTASQSIGNLLNVTTPNSLTTNQSSNHIDGVSEF